MKQNRRTLLTVGILLLCAVLIAAAVFVIADVVPQKKAQPVSSLETNAVFETEPTVVEPEREQAYEGELPAVLEQMQEEEAPTEEPIEAPEQTEEDAKVDALLAEMSDEEKLWQLFFVTPEALTNVNTATRAGDATKAALEKMPVGGIVYFAKNVEDQAQITEMIANSQSYSKLPLFIGTDEEGGTVSRLGSNDRVDVPYLKDMAVYGAAGDTGALQKDLTLLASSMKKIGFNLNFAPVADVAESTDSVIVSRSFGSDVKVCADMVSTAVEAMQTQGVAACLKHFPGYGAAKQDDHTQTVSVSRTAEELAQTDLVPFAAGIDSGAAFVMVTHLSYPAVTGSETPADLSAEVVTELLRDQLAFDGVIITDAQNMASVSEKYAPAEAAVKALQAGVDMILCPVDAAEAYQGIQSAVQDGTLTAERIDESVRRILYAKVKLGLF